MEKRLTDSEARIEGMCTTVIGALVKSGMLTEADLEESAASLGSPEGSEFSLLAYCFEILSVTAHPSRLQQTPAGAFIT